MKPIQIPVYFMAENDAMMQELGLPETPMLECPIKKVLFVRIDNISPYILDGGEEVTKIFSGVGEFFTPIPYDGMVNVVAKYSGDIIDVSYEV